MKKLLVFVFIVIIFTTCTPQEVVPVHISVDEAPDIEESLTAPTQEPQPEIPLPPSPCEPLDFVETAKRIINPIHGDIYIGMSCLTTSNYRYIDNSGAIHPASTIKAFIMEYALLQVHAGNAELDEVYDGVTLLFSIAQMIQISCNPSTGTVIARFGRESIDDWLLENYEDTRLFDDWRGEYVGQFNTTSVEDTIVFLEKLWINREDEPYKLMLEIMFGTVHSREKIPTATEGIAGIYIANKSGAFISEGLTADHDMAIVVKRDFQGEIEFAYALTFYSYSIPAYGVFPARPAIIDMALDIFMQVYEYSRGGY